MSSGAATPEVTLVVPDIGFPSGEEVAEHLLDLVEPMLIGLGSLSGALLAGRAAIAGTQALASAALRAATAQDDRVRAAAQARRSQKLWQDAAFAVCRTNARIDALRARIGRAGPEGASPDSPLPEPPSALDPVGQCLDQVLTWLVETDQAVRRLEAELALRTLDAAAAGPLSTAPDREAAARRDARLRARREQALAAYARARTEGEAAAALPVLSAPLPGATALTRDRAKELAEELLAGLDTAVSVADCATVREAVGHAVELADTRPADARRHLAEARDLACAANWRAADRRESAEWAAQQLRFLRQHGHPPETAADITALERILDRGDLVDSRQRAEISARVAVRTAALTRSYVAQLLRRQIAERASGVQVTKHELAPGIECIEWTPPGWGAEHWLRIVIDTEGTVRVQTVHRARAAHEETRQVRELDEQRCREAGQHLARLAEATAEAGIALDLVFDETRAVAAGAAADATAPSRRPADDEVVHPRARERER